MTRAYLCPTPGMLARVAKVFQRFSPLLANRFPTKLAPNVSNIMLRNPLFCSFAAF